MKRLESLARLGIMFGYKMLNYLKEEGFFVELPTGSIGVYKEDLLAWGHYTGFIVMNKEKQVLVNYNSKFGKNEKDLIPIIDANTEKGTYFLGEGSLIPYYFIPKDQDFDSIKVCIKFTNNFQPITSYNFTKDNYTTYRNACNISQANFIVIENNGIQHFVLLTD